jgi:hypothetical protein
MIPTRYIEELKNSPDDHVDFTGSFLEVFSVPGKIGDSRYLLQGDVYGEIHHDRVEVALASESR